VTEHPATIWDVDAEQAGCRPTWSSPPRAPLKIGLRKTRPPNGGGLYESHSEMALATITMMTMARPISSHGMSLRSRGVTRLSF